MIDRTMDRQQLAAACSRAPVVLLVGARQSGKTTLARTFVDPSSESYFDLEDPRDLARLAAPMTALEPLRGVVVIDEVQRHPDLFPVLRVLADRADRPATFLVLGSASPSALRQSSESLAGRVEVIELGGLRVADVGATHLDDLWLRGGFPASYDAVESDSSLTWRANYLRALSARDLPDFGMGLPPATIERFLALVAHAHGQLWNSAGPARALGIAESTVRRYVDALAHALLVRVLRPWQANVAKRQVRSPKVFFRDSGVVHSLLGIDDRVGLLRSTHVGASWEGFVVDEVIRWAGPLWEPYFWRTASGAEIDLVMVRGERRVGVEVKRTDAPTITPSMRAALSDVGLEQLVVYYPGPRAYRLSDEIEVRPASSLAERGAL